MEIEGWSQTLTAGPLLLIAAAAIAVLLVLIITFRVHAFLALIIISALTAFATGIPTSQVVPVLLYGFGNTLASVALLVGLGAMLGRLLETSGGAQVLADRLIRAFGEKRAPLALGVASLLFGFPIFFDAGLVVMLPVVFSVARRLGGSVLTYALPAVGAFSVMHVFLPPHPGPVTAATFFEANVGLVLLVGQQALHPPRGQGLLVHAGSDRPVGGQEPRAPRAALGHDRGRLAHDRQHGHLTGRRLDLGRVVVRRVARHDDERHPQQPPGEVSL